MKAAVVFNSLLYLKLSLYLKGLNNQESFRYNNELKTTAAFTSDRTVLFDFITSISFESTADIHQQISQKIAQQDVFKLEEISPYIEQELALGTPINFSKNETHSFQQWLQISVQKPIQREGLETKKNDKEFIIDRFIENNPKIVSVKNDEKITVSIPKNKSDTSLMTEI